MKSFLVQIILQAAPERCSIYRTANINTLATIHLGNTHLKENQDTIGVLFITSAKKWRQANKSGIILFFFVLKISYFKN